MHSLLARREHRLAAVKVINKKVRKNKPVRTIYSKIDRDNAPRRPRHHTYTPNHDMTYLHIRLEVSQVLHVLIGEGKVPVRNERRRSKRAAIMVAT